MSEQYEAPHILTSPINPITNDISIGRVLLLALLASLGTVEFILLFFSVFNLKLLWVMFFGFTIITTVWIGWAVGRSEKAYNYHLIKLYSKLRHMRGIECIRKFSDSTSLYMVQSVTGWKGVNEKTGMSQYVHNNDINWSSEKIFEGNWGFTLLTFPPAEGDKKTYNQRLKDAAQAIPYGYGEKDIIISGQDMSFIANDIEKLLEDPTISTIRKDELYSIYEKFIESADHVDLIYLIQIMLPDTEFEETAYSKMREVMDGYIGLLNGMGIQTILIKEEADIVLILSGMLTGELLFQGAVNES